MVSSSVTFVHDHILISLCIYNIFWCFPHKYSSLGPHGHDPLLVWRDHQLRHGTAVTDALVVAESLIVAPQADQLVLAARHEVLTLSGDGQRVDLALLTAVEHPDGLGVEGGPIGDLFVRTGGQELGLLGMVHDRLLEVLLLVGVDSGEGHEVPHDPGAVGGHGNGVLVVAFDLEKKP